jgi:hypothetical protein
MNFSIKKRNLSPYSWVNFSVLLLALGFVQFWVLTFYYKTATNEWVSWIANDGNAGSPFAFGQHYFGDYLTMHNVALARDIAALDNSYPPLGVMPFWLISWLPYRMGLFLWLGILISSLLLPLILTFRKMERENLWTSVIILGFLSVPMISVVDRGNSVGLLCVLFYLFYYFDKNKRIYLSGISLGLAIGMKVYPLLLIPFLIVKRKYKLALIATSFSVVSNIVSLIIWNRGNPITAVKYIVERVASVDRIFENGHGMYISSPQIFVNIVSRLGFSDSSFFDWVINNYRLLSLATLAVLLYGAARAKDSGWYLYGLCSIQLVPTLAYSYYRIWTPVAVAILLTERGFKTRNKLTAFENRWFLICVLNLSILTILNFWPVNLFPTIVMFLIFKSALEKRKLSSTV